MLASEQPFTVEIFTDDETTRFRWMGQSDHAHQIGLARLLNACERDRPWPDRSRAWVRMEEFAVQKEKLRGWHAAVLSDLFNLRHGAPCYFDGEDLTSALIARAEAKIRAIDKLIAEQDAEAPSCMGPPLPAECPTPRAAG